MLFLNGEAFTIGSQPYHFRPATASDSTNRIFLEIEIQGQRTHAMLDTGAPYLTCEPDIAQLLGLDPHAALGPTTLRIRGYKVQGNLYRLGLTLRAEEGEEIVLDATVFIPDSTFGWWPGLPSIVGLDQCLDRVRFAIDPSSETFYFGPHP